MSDSKKWGEINGELVNLCTLSNEEGASFSITEFSGRITSLRVPNEDGE